MRYPFLRPRPAKLSSLESELKEIEESNIYSNYGPVCRRFEAKIADQLFGGAGACLAVANATLGLMLGIKKLARNRSAKARYALMPSFTFAATAHAADWCGLTPLFYDIEPDTLLPSKSEEERLLKMFGPEIAVLVPYATFGNNLDLEWYENLNSTYGVPVVIDAAASLGSRTNSARQFGAESSLLTVFSMHATKTFSTSEGGLIFSRDRRLVEELRTMSNFGFGEPRSSTMPGLNAKLPEYAALMAEQKLAGFGEVVRRRQVLASAYKRCLPMLEFQQETGSALAHQFLPAIMAKGDREGRDEATNSLKVKGIELRTYFDPCVHEQPYFKEHGFIGGSLQVTERISRKIVSLPLYDDMEQRDVETISMAFAEVLEQILS